MKYIACLLLLLGSLPLAAQLDFKPIDTSGYKACRSSLSEEYEEKFAIALKKQSFESSAQKKVIKEIYAELQDDFLGKISGNSFICEDTYLTYLRQLLDEIIDKNNLKRDTYRILLSKDSEANAYNTGDGTIVINYGLFLILENEDELVFVMAHEVGHQHLGHVRNGILSFAKISTSEEVVARTKEIRKQKYRKGDMATSLLKKVMYQSYDERRKHEVEADSIGMTFYRNTQRSPASGMQILKKLAIADEERDSLSIADYHAIFDTENFKIKDRYLEQESGLFAQYDGERKFNIDSLKTHPACKDRLQLLEKVTKNDTASKKTASAKFDGIKKMAVYQSLYNQISLQDYGLALYEALKLYKHNKSDKVLKDVIATCLNEIRKARVAYTFNRYVPKIDEFRHSESLNTFITFLQNIKLSDLDTMINNFQK